MVSLPAGGRFVWRGNNRNAVLAEIRTLPTMLAELGSHANRIASAAGEGFSARAPSATKGRVRGRAAVVTDTYQAANAERTHHVLLTAAGGGVSTSRLKVRTTTKGR